MTSSELYTVYSKNNCSYCDRAIYLIEDQGFQVQTGLDHTENGNACYVTGNGSELDSSTNQNTFWICI